MPRPACFTLMAFAAISLVVALWTGLTRLGWDLPLPDPDFDSTHGPLMVIGFLGTLIGLERAVAIDRAWAYGIPFFSALSYLALLISAPRQMVALLAIVAASLYLVFFAVLHVRHASEHFVVMIASAVVLCMGNFIWLTESPLSEVVPWWVGFLVLMIAGERLELNRIRRLPLNVRMQFRFSIAVTLLGLLVSILDFFSGVRIAGAGLVMLALWLLRYDLAWQNLHQRGLPGFMGGCLIAGYVWLIVGGFLWISLAGSFVAGPLYDSMLHAIFLGFVFSMIFAHASIIFPIITSVNMAFLKSFYAHAILLHVSLVLRIFGDLADLPNAQKWGGALNALAILLFLLNNVRAVRREFRNPATLKKSAPASTRI